MSRPRHLDMEPVRLTPAVAYDHTRIQGLYSNPPYEHSHMAAGLYYPNPPRGEDYAYIGGDESLPGFYDGTSGESSMGSPALLQVRRPRPPLFAIHARRALRSSEN